MMFCYKTKSPSCYESESGLPMQLLGKNAVDIPELNLGKWL